MESGATWKDDIVYSCHDQLIDFADFPISLNGKTESDRKLTNPRPSPVPSGDESNDDLLFKVIKVRLISEQIRWTTSPSPRIFSA